MDAQTEERHMVLPGANELIWAVSIMKFDRVKKKCFPHIIITLNIIDGNYLDIYSLWNGISK